MTSDLLGRTFPEIEFYVDPVRVEEFVLATGVEPVAGYISEVGAVVPPGFIMYVTTYGAGPIHADLGLDMFRSVYGGTTLEQLVPIRVGDHLVVRPRITNVVAKETRSGPMTIVEVTTEYLNADGNVACIERSNAIERGSVSWS